MGHSMFSHLRVIALATVTLASLATVHSWAAPAIHGETRMTAPVQLQGGAGARRCRRVDAVDIRVLSGSRGQGERIGPVDQFE